MQFLKLCILIVIMVTKSKCSNITLIAEEFEHGKNFTCILEGNSLQSAVTWNTSIENYLALKESHYLPDSKIFCKYKEVDIQPTPCIPPQWSVSQALEFPFKPITDYRWESFPIIKVESERKKLLEYHNSTLRVTLSFRIKANASIFLCNNQNHQEESQTECFVIVINKTDIHIYSKVEGVENHLNSITIDEIQEDQWTNLIISHNVKENIKILKLRIAENQCTVKIEGKSLNEINLSVHSEELSLWKVHNYWFLSTNTNIPVTQIGKRLPAPILQPLCISLYVALCPNCVLTISMDMEEDAEEIASKKVENINHELQGGTYSWREIKVISKMVKDSSKKNVLLYVKAVTTNGSKNGFWAIDKLRLCDPNEIRVSNLFLKETIKQGVECQPLRENSISISDPINGDVCEKSKIGTDCNITCESIFGVKEKYCQRKLICTEKNTKSECHCSSGYQGSFCKNACDKGTWGNGCSSKCKNCKNNKCHPVNGICSEGCADGFDPPNCIKPTTVTNIHTTSITTDSIVLEWDFSFEIGYKFNYIVSYKHKKYGACKEDLKNPTIYTITVIDRKIVTVNNLLPYSEYSFTIAAIFNENQGNVSHFSTLTDSTATPNNEEGPLRLSALQETSNSFPLITLTGPRCSNIKGHLTYEVRFTCSEDWCNTNPVQLLTIPYINRSDSENSFTYNRNDLQPYSSYTITAVSRRTNGSYNKEKIIKTELKTKEGRPPKVHNLDAYSMSENSISLRWKEPYPSYGTLEKYQVKCTGINPYILFTIKPTPCELWEEDFTCAEITNLSKNTKYDVWVSAKNYGVEAYGEEQYKSNIYTKEIVSEPPLNVMGVWENNDVVKLQWEHPYITNGPLTHFYIEIFINETEYEDYTSFSTNFTIMKNNRTYSKILDLKDSSVYNIIVYPYNKFKGKPSEPVTIKMPPPTPQLSIVPTITCSGSKCELTLLTPVNLSKNSYLYVIVDDNETAKTHKNITRFLINSAKSNKNRTNWLAIAKPMSKTINLMKVQIGDGTNTNSVFGIAINKPLSKGSNYLVTVIIASYFYDQTRFSEEYRLHTSLNTRMTKTEEANSFNFLYCLFLLLVIPIGGLIYCCNKNKQLLPNSITGNPAPHNTISKPIGIVKPETLELVDASTPLISSQVCYENLRFTQKIKLEDFEEYVRESIGTDEENGELVRQHKLFVRGQTQPWEYGLKKENKFKNRYNNLVAYDHSRVVLEKINKDAFSDYINANYINGYKQPRAYIATQGPKPTTVCDFWRMVWQERTTNIVMVANVEEDGKKKTEEYWPKLNSSITFGSIEIYHKKSEIYSNYVFRTLIVTKGKEERTIEQLHFTSWPDHGVPLYPQNLVPFIEKIRTIPQDFSPIIVHCSAGVGRTGTIILCDYILRMAKSEGAVDFLATLQEMRENRANLVDSPNQYKLAHLVVLETLFGLDTTLQCDYELEQKINALITSEDLHKQMEYLEKIVWQDQTMWSSFKLIPYPANNKKNRFTKIIPEGYGCVYISRFPVSDEYSDYINAVEVDGFNIPKRFIVTQQPLPNTISDFWRMVFEKDVTTIVSLNDIEECDLSSCIFWPEEDKIFDFEFLTISYLEREEYTTHEVIKLSVDNKNEMEDNEHGKYKNITIIKMKSWPPLKVIPESLDALMETWEETDKASRGSNPIVVTCYDGAKASGVFVALSFVIEKIKLEQICDVCLAVRTIRRSRKEFVTNLEQFQLLYEAAVLYLKGFDTYSNFPIINK